MSDVRRTERGWAGHLCVAAECRFHRNTLLECGERRIVVSTVGRYMPAYNKHSHTAIGYARYAETMAFEAKFEAPYWDADVSHEVRFESRWSLDKDADDNETDAMHEAVVDELSRRMESGGE